MTEPDKPLVHLVDDDEAIRHSASFMLRLSGYRVQTHPDGVSFLDNLDTLESGCILLDVQMPKMNGLAVQKALNERGCEMPVIVLTGHGDVSVAVQAMKEGAVNFVEKPYEKQVLLAAINEGFLHLQNLNQGVLQKASAAASNLGNTIKEGKLGDALSDVKLPDAVKDLKMPKMPKLPF